MKSSIFISAILAAGLLAGCNQPNNGEQPPGNELPAPAQSTGNDVDNAPAPADRQDMPTDSASSAPTTATSSPGAGY